MNVVTRLVGRPGQVDVPAESRLEVSAHGFWNQGTTERFDILVVNLITGSYMRMTPENDLAKEEKKKKYFYPQN